MSNELYQPMKCPVKSCDRPSMTRACLIDHLRDVHEYDEEDIEVFKDICKNADEAVRAQMDEAFQERKYGVLEPNNFVPTMRNGESYILRSKLHPGYCIQFNFFYSSAHLGSWNCASCVSARWKHMGSAHTAYSRDNVWISDPDGGVHVCDWPANEHKELEMYKEATLYIVKREAKKTGNNDRKTLLSAIMDLHSAPELSRFTKEEISAIQSHLRMRMKRKRKTLAAETTSERTSDGRSQSRSPVAEMGVSAMDIILGSEDKPGRIQLESETSMVADCSGHSLLDSLREEILKEKLNVYKMKSKKEAQELKNNKELHAMRMRTEQIMQEMYLKKMKTESDL